MRANKRADKRLAQYSTRRFLSLLTHYGEGGRGVFDGSSSYKPITFVAFACVKERENKALIFGKSKNLGITTPLFTNIQSRLLISGDTLGFKLKVEKVLPSLPNRTYLHLDVRQIAF